MDAIYRNTYIFFCLKWRRRLHAKPNAFLFQCFDTTFINAAIKSGLILFLGISLS